jgi:hypothetical protein
MWCARYRPAPHTRQARWFEAVRSPASQEGMARAGIEPRPSPSRTAFTEFVLAETERWTRVIREAGITAQ